MMSSTQRAYARNIIKQVQIVREELVIAGHDADHETVIQVIQLSYMAAITDKLDNLNGIKAALDRLVRAV